MSKANRKAKKLRPIVKGLLDQELKSVLHDVSYRLGVLYDAMEGGRIGSRDLNLATHQLDGYTVTDDTPAGGITWADVNIVYKGVNYAITGGNSTMKYIWFDFSATPNTTLQMTNTKPTLTEDDVLVFINNNGKHQTAMSAGKMISGFALLDGTVGGSEIGASAIGSTNIANGAVISGKLGTGAVATGNIANGAVTTTQLGSKAVATGNIADGAVSTAQLGSKVVATGNIADGAVNTTQLGSKAVATANIQDGAVNTAQIAGSAIDSSKIAGGAVGSTQIADSAVIAAKIGAGAVAASKLNTAQHMVW